MGWNIKVWHVDVSDRTRLSIEAEGDIPDEIISALAGSYWFEEVQFAVEDWSAETFEDGTDDGPRLQG